MAIIPEEAIKRLRALERLVREQQTMLRNKYVEETHSLRITLHARLS